MGELNTGRRHPLSGADPEPFFHLHRVSLDNSQEERTTVGTWRSIIRLTYGEWG